MASQQNNRKYIGLIGFGEMGKRLVSELNVKSIGMVDIEAVVEPDDKKYDQGSEWIRKKPKRYLEVKTMLDDEKNKKIRALDGVMIASPNGCHLENLKYFEGYDIPIMLEKPLDSTFEKICNIVRFAEKYKNRILVDHVMRYAPILAKAKELLEAGAIGKICSANFVQSCFYGNHMYRNFRRTMQGGGGMFIEKATHDFDIMLYMTSAKPVSVAAIAKRQAYGGDKPDDLVCSKCDEKFTCKESRYNALYRFGDHDAYNNPPRPGDHDAMEVEASHELCIFAKSVDVPDNETSMIEFDNGIFGTYSQCFFTPSSYDTRVYELIGLEGVMRIDLSIIGDHNKGKIIVCRRFGTPGDIDEFGFDYLNRIHYNGGGVIARHFYEMLTGNVEPFTTVKQAFLAELIGYAANMAAKDKRIVNVCELVPDDLKFIC